VFLHGMGNVSSAWGDWSSAVSHDVDESEDGISCRRISIKNVGHPLYNRIGRLRVDGACMALKHIYSLERKSAILAFNSGGCVQMIVEMR
jgi:hypothetical protein